MKRLLIFLFFLFPNLVSASSLQLSSLEVLNGVISPSFDSLNNFYTIELNKDEDMIHFQYKEEEGIVVKIINNYSLKNNDVVTLEVLKGEEKVTYSFHVLKEEEAITSVFKEEVLEEHTMMYEYKIFVVPGGCFLLIVLAYKIIFHKRHKK